MRYKTAYELAGFTIEDLTAHLRAALEAQQRILAGEQVLSYTYNQGLGSRSITRSITSGVDLQNQINNLTFQIRKMEDPCLRGRTPLRIQG
jgi:hypothetical protein